MLIRRVVVALLLIGALILILGPAAFATLAMARGEMDAALSASAPLLLLPGSFLGFGLWSSVRRGYARRTPTQTSSLPTARIQYAHGVLASPITLARSNRSKTT